MSDKLVLVDGSSYLYRAFHAMPNLTNSQGEPTGAVYGVVNMLRRLLKEQPSEYFAVVFDASGPTFRDQMYPEYKANRPPMPDELRAQIQPLHDVISALGLPLICVKGVEADDVIGTLAVAASEIGIETLIASGDKDLAQLVGDTVLLMDSMKDITYNTAGVVNKFGVPPERMVDFLTLVGDSVDNIPGVPKVGPKTASKWLNEFGSLDELVQHADDIGGKVGENLRAALDKLPMSKALATIKLDVQLDVHPDGLQLQPADKSRLRTLYAGLEFKTWLSELGGLSGGDDKANSPPVDYQVIVDQKALNRWIKRLQSAKLISIDTETTSLDPMQARIVGLSFTDRPCEAAYLPLGHDYAGAPDQLALEDTLAQLKPLLEDPALPKVGQNLKYDRSVLLNHGIELRGIQFDTMLESYVLDSTGSRHDMDTLSLKYLGLNPIRYEDVAGKGKKQLTFNQVPVEIAAPYAAEDADLVLRLHQTLYPRLKQFEKQHELLENIEMPLLPVLSRIERTGVRVDSDMLARQSSELGERIDTLAQQAFDQVGADFNIASPKQIQEILFEKLQLPVISKTPKGQPSTSESVLQELAEQHELPKLILEHRALSKLRSTYTEKLPLLVNPDTGRVHTSYHQASVATGRLSSTDPNLQNIPVRTADGRRIREAFVPESGSVLLAADYSQIELRIMAHLSGDEGLLAAFAENQDIHRATASEVFSTALEDVDSDQRRSAKAINFGLIYGMSAFGLARQLGTGRSEAQSYIELYFDRYPGVKAYMEQIRTQAREQQFVETIFGRKLYLPDISSSNHARRQGAERAAINAPMQGTAADLIKLAMLAIDSWLTEQALKTRMIMQVHDELVLEVPDSELKDVPEVIASLMSGVAELRVPLRVDVGSGANWAEAHS
ncbi:MAG TPA: DNA polymerase I [Gammaproteobacteria bacterium]|nr:DNA polymerase I [Gammaproteobacteria bacterium]